MAGALAGFRKQQDLIMENASRSLAKLFSEIDLATLYEPENHQDFMNKFLALVDTNVNMSSVHASGWLQDQADKAFGESIEQRLAPSYGGQPERGFRWAITPTGKDGKPRSREEILHDLDAVMRGYIQRGARDSIVATGRQLKGRTKWARVPSGRETCSWCLMLVSRGAVYESAKAASVDNHGDGFHLDCDCVAVPEKLLRGAEKRDYESLVADAKQQYEMARKVAVELHGQRVTAADIQNEWRRQQRILDFDTQIAKIEADIADDKRGRRHTSDNSIQYAKWDRERLRVLEALRERVARGLRDGSERLLPRNPVPVPDGWPDDLPTLTARKWNHLLFGYKTGGAHLYGYGWLRENPDYEFPAHISSDDIFTGARDILQSKRDEWASNPSVVSVEGTIKGVPVKVTLGSRKPGGARQILTIQKDVSRLG